MTQATSDTISVRRPGRPAQPLLNRQRLLGLAGVVAVAGYGVEWWLASRFIEATDNAYVRADVVTVSSRISGYVVAVPVADNQPVRRGDLLARIDASIYQARVDQADASVAVAQADEAMEVAALAALDAQLLQQESVIAQAQAEVAAAEADAGRASFESRRQQNLAERQISSAQRLEAAQADQRKTAAASAAARAALASQRERLTVLTAERKGRQAALDKVHAARHQAEALRVMAAIDLENTAIRAPTDGIVGQRVVRTGQYVDPGQPLLAVVPAQDAYVVANFKETQLAHIVAGQPVTLEVDAFEGDGLRGHVDSFAPASGAQFALLPPDNATGNFTKIVQRMPVRISIDSGQPRAADLRPGMSVIAHVDTRTEGGRSHER